MLRPATPLSVLLFGAFALLLLSILSAPIIEAIPLANFDGVSFGVFGYCDNGVCSGIQVGYSLCKLSFLSPFRLLALSGFAKVSC